MVMTTTALSADRLFSPERSVRALARELYATVRDLPLVCPHGHVNPALLSDPQARFSSPAHLFVIPDHYVTRMLHSQGIPLEDLGVRSRDGTAVETDDRQIWRRFAENFHLFTATPSGEWLTAELVEVFGIEERLGKDTADDIYDELVDKLSRPEYTPRALFEKFNIEVLTTTDAATASLDEHRALIKEGWGERIKPTFRPDALFAIDAPTWRDEIGKLSATSGIEVKGYRSFIEAVEARRATFRELGATATDHAVLAPHTDRLDERTADAVFDRARRGAATGDDAARFTAHMLMEMARMSVEDGLVMQLHVGSLRNYDRAAFARFGPDIGCDIPVRADFTNGLRELLNAYGNDPRFRIILFNLDETTYSRELAPLAGYFPAVLLGPPWWFYDSANGMRRFLEAVTETAGVYNLAGFNDDTRAFASIPARHDVWRRVTCDWLAELALTGRIAQDDAPHLATLLARDLARRAYRFDQRS